MAVVIKLGTIGHHSQPPLSLDIIPDCFSDLVPKRKAIITAMPRGNLLHIFEYLL